MKQAFVIATVVFVFYACEKKQEENIIPREKFISLLVQMHLIEADFSFNPEVDHRSMQKNYKQYEELFKRYKTDSLQVVKTFDYYDDKQEELFQVYKVVLDCLNTMAGKAKPPVLDPAEKNPVK
ncbi:MAG TPA: DUF4296 domain-containing protein [Flavobacteriales bacterium]|nr:DUF4296 domain-containing protein [Flavobacteriales bacterium]